MTDQELKENWGKMTIEGFKTLLEETSSGELMLITDTRGLGLEDSAPPMYYVESSPLVGVVRARKPLYLGSLPGRS